MPVPVARLFRRHAPAAAPGRPVARAARRLAVLVSVLPAIALGPLPARAETTAGATAATGAAAPAPAGPTVELNRLEDAGAGCRLTLVVANPGPQRFEELKLDLVLFDPDGVVARRLAVETGPVRANKTVVRLFDAADLSCAKIGRLLLNDVVACADESGPVAGCVDRIATTSRAAVPFER